MAGLLVAMLPSPGLGSFPEPEAPKEDLASSGRHLWTAPNQMPNQTTLFYSLAEPGNCNLSLYDVSGKLVARLFSGGQRAGHHSLAFSGRTPGADALRPGICYLRLCVGVTGQVITHKLIVE